ncbi:MAG TPA: ribosome-associated translation inhibitor RaiA [Anaerolineales bacterium]|jgi:putative sigma-54 modulation protein
MSIKVEINARNLEVGDRLHDYVLDKVDKLDRFLDILETATVDLNYAESARSAEDRQVAQITVRGKGVLLRAEERTDDMFASVDAATDKLLRQIDRYKGRHWSPRGDGRSVTELEPGWATVDEEPDEAPVVVRRKHFLLLPMDELEAIEQMDLLGHERFFVYLDGTRGQVNVLYKRRDGSYGLIETEIA